MKSFLKDKNSFVSANLLKKIIPEGSVVETYFLYAGELELSLALNNRFVVSHTNKYPVYEFWWMAKHRGFQIGSMAESIAPRMSEELLIEFQENWYLQRDPVYRSALFYILCRCSKFAYASCGEVDKSGFTRRSLAKLKNFEADNFQVVLDKFANLYENINSEINSNFKLFPVGRYSRNYLMVPDEGRAPDLTYIDHHKLIGKLEEADYNWIAIYKKHNEVFEQLKNYRLMMVDKYGNQTSRRNNCEDIVVTNF